MKNILSILLLLSFSFSQDLSIEGKVLNADNNQPIVDVNIFIIDSSFGGATDAQGNFIIENLENKNYTLVASALGYKDSIITFNPSIKNNFIFKLERTSLMASSLEVIGRYPSKHDPNFTDNITRDLITEQKSQTLTELFRNILGVDVQMEHNTGRNANVSIRGSSDYKPGGYKHQEYF